MENPIYQFKTQQKELVASIKKEKDDFNSYKFRHNHIAYCELRGREREQIEQPRFGNESDETLIDSIDDAISKRKEMDVEYSFHINHGK